LDREIFETDTGILVIESGPRSGSRYALDSELISIGREKDADIFLDDVTVSRRHAIIERDGSIYTVSDVGSLNGTYLNAKSVRSEELTDGDVVQIGRFKLVFFHGTAQN
jgi:pSer/pThr/pTyr-binding forkhead associated (FHA) protein